MTTNISTALANIKYQNVDLLTNIIGRSASANSANAANSAGASFLDVLNSLGGIGANASAGLPGAIGALPGMQGAGGFDALSGLGGIFGDGTLQLFSAFSQRQTTYSKEQSRLELMQDRLGGLSGSAQSLQQLTADSSTADIKAALQDFVNQYNAWDTEFDADVASGGVLQDSQPANMARFSMQRAVTDFFNGRGNGGLGSGMSELGLEVGKDGQLTFNTALFDKAMAGDRTAAVKTINNMANGLARDADFMLKPGSVLANRLGRLEDALAFIDQNKPNLATTQEKPTQQAAAMSMYQSMMGL